MRNPLRFYPNDFCNPEKVSLRVLGCVPHIGVWEADASNRVRATPAGMCGKPVWVRPGRHVALDRALPLPAIPDA